MTKEQLLTRTLRTMIVVLAVLTLAAVVVSLATGGFAAAPFAMFASWLIMPGLVVWLHPKPVFVLMWSALAWFGGLMLIGGGPHVWAAAAVPYLIVPVLVMILFVLPIATGVFVLASRVADARNAEPALPGARVVSRRRA